MTKIFDLASARAASADLDRDLTDLLKKYGLTMTNRKISVGVSEITIKVDGKVGTDPEGLQESERKSWETFAPLYGLPADAFGKTIMMGLKKFVIVGFNGRTRKVCKVKVARQPDGKVYLADPNSVKVALKLEEEPA